MPSTAATELARQLFSREMHGEAGNGATTAAAERICSQLAAGLSRWFGTYGSQALMTRALASVQALHPVLLGVTMTEEHCLVGLVENAAAHGADDTLAGIVAAFAALADLIGRLIGEDLAMRLLEQSTILPAARSASAPLKPRTNDGMPMPGTP